jgi:2-phosphosulfolactate phosphatase
MKLDVVLLPKDLQPEHVNGRTVVVFDVLRATTTMTAALAAGVEAIRVYPNTTAARKDAMYIGMYPAPVLCGEENCLRPEGFHLGNSPAAFNRGEHAGHTVFMSTTNGTRAILAAKGAKLILIGALVNATAVARASAEAGNDVTLLCAGTNGRVAMEDVIGAGAVLGALRRVERLTEESDTARIASRLFTAASGDLREALSDSTGGRNVIAAGLAEDIVFAASLDRFRSVVGYFTDGKVRRMQGSADHG